jgi:hypothetical protein
VSGRRVDWVAVALYVVFGGIGVAFVGWVLWRLALRVDWMAAALLGLVIVFGLLMVSFDLRRAGGEPVADEAAEAAPTKRARRVRPPKAKPARATPAAPPPAEEPPPDAPAQRGPRNRAGRAPIAEPPARPRRRPRT